MRWFDFSGASTCRTPDMLHLVAANVGETAVDAHDGVWCGPLDERLSSSQVDSDMFSYLQETPMRGCIKVEGGYSLNSPSVKIT
jgi:hypothetical protein